MEYLKTRNRESRDKFVPVMTDFITVATYNFSEVEEAYVEMKQKVIQKKISIFSLVFIIIIMEVNKVKSKVVSL